MENKVSGHTIPGTITKTGNGDILEKSVGIDDGFSRFGSIIPEVPGKYFGRQRYPCIFE